MALMNHKKRQKGDGASPFLMSQAERHAKQAQQAAQRAAEQMQLRRALAPKPLAVYVRMALRTLRQP